MPFYDSSAMRRHHPFALALVAASAGLLYLPLLAVAVYSVNAARIGLVWRGFTLDWYTRLLDNDAILDAAQNTLVLALISTAIATVLGTLLAIGLLRYPWSPRTRRLLDAAVDLPVITPDIVFAAALVVAFAVLRSLSPAVGLGMTAMIIGHVTFQTAFVALVVRSRLMLIGPTVAEAARDLYATPAYLLRHVTLPLLAPGIAAGAVLAFTLSLDDFVISFFTAGPTSNTLPIYVYSSVRRGLSPELHALSTLIVFVTVVLVIGLQRLSGPSQGDAS